MYIEEAKEKLKKAGYTVHKKVDQKLLERRNDLYFYVNDYIRHVEYVFYKRTGKRYSVYNITAMCHNNMKRKLRKAYLFSDYNEIPDEQWPAIEKELFSDIKKYIDRRYEKELSA